MAVFLKQLPVSGEVVAPVARPRAKLGEVLVTQGVIDRSTLDRAIERQREIDAPLGRILLTDGSLTPSALHGALAAQAELPVIDLDATPPDPDLFAGLDPFACLEIGAVPWRRIGNTRILAISRIGDVERATDLFGGSGRDRLAIVLAPAEQIRRAITLRFSGGLRDRARLRCPSFYSCRSMGAPRSRAKAAALASGLLALVAIAPTMALQAVMVWVMAMNVATMGLRVFALFARLRGGRVAIEPELPRLASFKRLPTISLLVPLKGEAKMAEALVRGLAELDYPAALLDVKLILEEEDFATRAALEAAGLPSWAEILTVPRDGRLQTKPRALNFALPFCRGTVIGVYDAEDRPEPGQLRAVARALSEAPPDVACVQGYLDFYNAKDNWLSRCFTIEYAIWFRVLLHGIQRLGLPIPLGGTTVFFRRGALDAIGAWDAHNVTEDADLGMRLARFGFRCAMIRTVTMEEANCRTLPWIRQRSRWLKGYAITWLTHMRRPVRLLRDLGPGGFLGFQILFLGAMTSYLSMPILWLLVFAGLGLGLPVWDGVSPGLVAAFIATSFVGQIVMLVLGVAALRDAGRPGLLPWLGMLLIYWPLGAVAAYRAVGEAILRPFHWHKTEHGFARTGVTGKKRLFR